MTMDAGSEMVRHCLTVVLSKQSPIWTTDMYGANEPPVARFSHKGVLAFTGRTLRRLGGKTAECRRNRRAYQKLIVMSDRELADIAISRLDIDAIFSGTYERAKPNSSDMIVLDRRGELRPSGDTKPCKRAGENPRSR